MERLPTTENQQEKPERNKRLFLDIIKSKFTAMAMAGFITLGGGWAESFADQLKINKPEKDTHIEFVLETAITDEKLNNFKEKVSLEEPEFRKWADEYVRSTRIQLDNLTNSILSHDIAGEDDLKEEKNLRESLTEPGTEGVSERLIVGDHQVISEIKKRAEVFKQYQKFLGDNLEGVLWGTILMEDSKAVRDNLLKLVNPPEIYFGIHEPMELAGIMGYAVPIKTEDYKIPRNEIKKYNPRIKILPGAFQLKYNDPANFNVYLNVLIHELGHSLNPGSDDKKRSVDSSALMCQLREGITQNLAFEVVQYLGTKKDEIKPIVGSLNYDTRLIVAAILEGVFRAQSGERDTLAKWHTAMIGDGDMTRNLATAFQQLGLDKMIARDISDLNDPVTPGDLTEERPFKRILIDMLARLRMTDVSLSPEFLKAIISNNRRLDDWQIREFEKTIELGSINTKVNTKVGEIKNEVK